jgi:hypothetical protein
MSFRDNIVTLQKEFLRDRYNSNRSKEFWHIADNLKDDDVILWAERATKIKDNFINESWNTNEWMQCNNIIHTYKNRDPMTQLPWTKAQKRFCVFQIVKFWDDLESIYCI